MVIKFRCPNGHLLQVNGKHVGKTGACPQCSAPVKIPYPGSDVAVGAQDSTETLAHREIGSDHASDSSLIFGHGTPCRWCGKPVPSAALRCNWCGKPLFRHLEVRKEDDLTMVQFVEDQILDERTTKRAAEELYEVARDMGHILALDFSTVVALSGAMLTRLITLQTKLEGEGRQVRLCNFGKELREVFAATKLDHLLHIENGKRHRPAWSFASVLHGR